MIVEENFNVTTIKIKKPIDCHFSDIMDAKEYYKNDNLKIKLSLENISSTNKNKRKNIFIQQGTDGEVLYGLNSLNIPKQIYLLKKNKNDKVFLREFAEIVKNKTDSILKIHEGYFNWDFLYKEFAYHIRKKFEYIIETYENEDIQKEARAYLIVWIFFEFFVIFENNYQNFLNINDYFYKYIFIPDVDQISRTHIIEEYNKNDKNYINFQMKKLKFSLKICDFKNSSEICKVTSNELEDNFHYIKLFSKVNREFSTIFQYLYEFFNSYNEIISNPENNERSRIDIQKNIENLVITCKEILQIILRTSEQNGINDNNEINYLKDEIFTTLRIISGDLNAIRENCDNFKEFILMNIYYRFYRDDFIHVLRESLHQQESSNELDDKLISIIIDQPIEFYQNLKGNIPKWFQFLFLESLFDNNKLPNQEDGNLDNMTLRNYDYADFLNYLLIIDVPYQEYYIYSTQFDDCSSNSRMYWAYIEKVATKSILYEFNEFKIKKEKENISDKTKMKTMKKLMSENIKNIFDDLRQVKFADFITNSLARICYRNFLQLGYYKKAVEYLLLDKELDCKMFDELLYIILLNDQIPPKFKSLIKITSQSNATHIDFIKNLVEFDSIKFEYPDEYLYKLKQFFSYCFIEEKCPKIMWLWILRMFQKLFTENFENFREIRNNNYRIAFSNTYKNESLIKKEIKNFVENYYEDERLKFFYLLRGNDKKEYISLIEIEILKSADFLYNHQFMKF